MISEINHVSSCFIVLDYYLEYHSISLDFLVRIISNLKKNRDTINHKIKIDR